MSLKQVKELLSGLFEKGSINNDILLSLKKLQEELSVELKNQQLKPSTQCLVAKFREDHVAKALLQEQNVNKSLEREGHLIPLKYEMLFSG